MIPVFVFAEIFWCHDDFETGVFSSSSSWLFLCSLIFFFVVRRKHHHHDTNYLSSRDMTRKKKKRNSQQRFFFFLNLRLMMMMTTVRIILLLLVLKTRTLNAFNLLPLSSTTSKSFYNKNYYYSYRQVEEDKSKRRTTTTTTFLLSSSTNDNNNNEEECPVDDTTCLTSNGFVPDTSSFVTVNEVYVAEIESLRDKFPSFESNDDEGSNRIKFNRRQKGSHILSNDYSSSSQRHDQTEERISNMQYNEIIGTHELVLIDIVRKRGMKSISRAFHRAGPRKVLHFDPSKVNAAIVTCGGLCPGLNNVIRELVHSLYYLYGANEVYGIVGGFHGFYNPDYKPILLTNELVADIHHEGGTILRSSRGGFDIDKILNFLKEKNISQLYVIGGDGTHRGAYAIHQACIDNGLNIAVAGIPKTIDNDIDYIDRSFGFQSAVEAAQAGIRTAKIEAMCNVPNGIGIIKLMGRSAGFLAAFAALGSGDVDLLLVPEVPIILDGPDGILPYLRNRVKEQKYVVVVVAEGAGEELLGISDDVDAGGNRKLPKIAELLKTEINKYFKSFNEEATIKYIDPSYTVRSVPANGADSLYCMQLAQSAVHGAMAGITGFSVGLVNKSLVYLPIPLLVATSPRSMNPYGTTWEHILAMTGQPNTVPPKETTLGESLSMVQEEQESFQSGLPEPTAH